MKLPGAGFLRDRRGAKQFGALPPEQRAIVFYAEDAASSVHFRSLLDELLEGRGRRVTYLTSDPDDPILAADRKGLRAFAIGNGTIRTSLFLGIDAGVVVMTLPELETHHIKRSRMHEGVHYAYVFHSLVSTHMIYREGAFDHFDSVLCAGPHQVTEIRRREEQAGLPAKTLVEHGYARLDALTASAAATRDRAPNDPLRVLIAPSWGPHCIVETCGVELMGTLLDAGLQVTMRPHPMTRRHEPAAIDAIAERFGDRDAFTLEEDVASQTSLERADVMISDWSGAAFEFAFAFERPVVFLDGPPKVNNSDYESLGIPPVESSRRGDLGVVVAPDALADLPRQIAALCGDPGDTAARIRDARDQTVFHAGSSGPTGAQHIVEIADAWLADPDPGD